ncbi:DUF4282 domain-containing protein [Branchiibius sp. NY16-3462-2]|uniref:DUF4282 domain-containing protein n=1 Tax=Branchiibius sp. NY16-3462-2 TaxID=1807500 RepID=UPI0007929873|nr:DUF4282 domain-containing protein [Branchiibius sp. NY16-3462-2]KYH43407.1 hypothetical protein AZH51_16745 [Branchiibius sp. NY16-3462-2]
MSEQPPPNDPFQQPGQQPQQPYQQPGQQQPYQQPYQQPVDPTAPQYGGALSTPQDDLSGGLRSLFDFSFKTFATPKIVRIVYIVIAVVIALAWLGALISMLANGEWGGFFVVLIFGTLVALVYLALARMTLEFYYSVVRMSEDIHQRLR